MQQKTLIAFLLAAALCVGLRYHPVQQLSPPELTGTVLVNREPTTATLYLGGTITSVNVPVCAVQWNADGTVTDLEKQYVQTRGGTVEKQMADRLENLSKGELICTQSISDGLLAAFYDETAEEPLTVVELDAQSQVVLTAVIPNLRENAAIYAMSADEQTIYLFDYLEETESILIIQVDRATGVCSSRTVDWQDIAGPYAEMYHLGGLILSPNHVAVRDGVLYIVEQHYGEGDGLTRVFVSAYDLEAEQLIGVQLLGNCGLVLLEATEDSLCVLTNDPNPEPLTLSVFDRQDLNLRSVTQYELPAQWVARTEDDGIEYSLDAAKMTETRLQVALPYRTEADKNLAYLAAYDRQTAELLYLGELQIDQPEYEIWSIE